MKKITASSQSRKGRKVARKPQSEKRVVPSASIKPPEPPPGKVISLADAVERIMEEVRIHKKVPTPIKDLTVMSVTTIRKIVVTRSGHFVRQGTNANGSGRAVRFLSDGEPDVSQIEDLIEDLIQG